MSQHDQRIIGVDMAMLSNRGHDYTVKVEMQTDENGDLTMNKIVYDDIGDNITSNQAVIANPVGEVGMEEVPFDTPVLPQHCKPGSDWPKISARKAWKD